MAQDSQLRLGTILIQTGFVPRGSILGYFLDARTLPLVRVDVHSNSGNFDHYQKIGGRIGRK